MESNRRTFMFLILIEIAFIKLAVGNETARNICLDHMRYLCGDIQTPTIDNCGKWAVLRFTKEFEDLPVYIYDYFEKEIYAGMIAPGLKTIEQFCSERAETQLESCDYDIDSLLRDSDDEEDSEGTTLAAEALLMLSNENYGEGTSSAAEETLEFDESRIKLMLIAKCLNKLKGFNDSKKKVIEYAVLSITLESYQGPYTYNSKTNVIAQEYLTHISDTVKVTNRNATEPVKYCSTLEKKYGPFLPHEMYKFHKDD